MWLDGALDGEAYRFRFDHPETATALEFTALKPGLSLARIKVSGLATADGVARWSRMVAAKDDTLVLDGLTMKTPPAIRPRAETVAELTVLVRLRSERRP